jgi:hypothetical protein
LAVGSSLAWNDAGVDIDWQLVSQPVISDSSAGERALNATITRCQVVGQAYCKNKAKNCFLMNDLQIAS